jgi:tetratricopeptide (TPR) repeat protein
MASSVEAHTSQEQSKRLDDLDTRASLCRALDECPIGDPRRLNILSQLSDVCLTQFETDGDLESLAEAVALGRQALDLRPPGHPDRSMSLSNLANALHTRYEQLGDSDALSEALKLHRQTLDLCPPGHPNRSVSLSNLAGALHTQYEKLGDSDALAEALDLHRQALDLCPLGHPGRSVSLNNLATALQSRSKQLGDSDALAEALDLHRQALDLHPPGHPHRSGSLNNLAGALQTRHELLGDSDALSEALDLHRQALELRPYPHPDRPSSLWNLGLALETRFAKQTLACDLDEAIEMASEGLRFCNDGHPMRVIFLFRIATYLLREGTQIFDFGGGISHILEGLRDRTSPANERLRLAIEGIPKVEAVIQLASENRVAATVSRLDRDEMVLQVYILVLQLLPRAASLGLNHTGRLRALSGAETISRDAAARAVSAGRTTDAIEMLEEGRGVFWSQALRLRTTDIDLLPDQDAQKLRRLFSTLESGNTHDGSMSTVQRERHIEERRRLGEAAERMLADIRSRPGFARFLLPPAFSALLQSLPDKGFAVMLVASKLGHHALILSRAETQVKHVSLETPPGGSFSQAFRAILPRDGGQNFSALNESHVDRALGISRRRHKKPRDSFDEMLAQLWMLIVKPVVVLLNLKVCFSRPPVSRFRMLTSI